MIDYGLHPNTPESDYRELRAMNFSTIVQGRRDPARMAWALQYARKQSDAMALGTAVHCAVLEPFDFVRRFAVAPDVDRRTKAGKATWAEFEFSVSTNGHTILDADTHAQAQAMRRSCLAHPVARKLLATAGDAEVVAHWKDPSGYAGKARIDRMLPTILLDLKTAKDASPEAMEGAIDKYGYFIQAAWYMRGFEAVTGKRLPFVMVVVESEPPYPVGVYAMDDETLRRGEAECDRILAAWREWRKAPRPAMYGGDDIQQIGLKPWAMQRYVPVASDEDTGF